MSLEHFETVTKEKLVATYIRAALAPLRLIAFDGDRIVLTADGEALRSKRERGLLLEPSRST